MSDTKQQPIGADGKPLVEYQYAEALEAAKEYFKGDDLAAMVWLSKYALKDSFGHIYEKSPDQMHWRIANEIARIENKYPNPMSAEKVHELLKEFRYIIPQGGPMTGIGNNLQIASLSNCFVIGHKNPADSYGGIIRIDEEQVQLMKRRGGVGHDLSHLRPTGSPVLNSALTSTGIVPFMERYSNSTREVAQDGRRGALMLSLSIKHPDAENFIDAKVESQGLVTSRFSLALSPAEKQALAPYMGKQIVLGFRPENTRVGSDFELKVLSNENLGMNTLVHGHVGADGKGERITCKLAGWCNYRAGDVVPISITRKHFFDKETTNAIKLEVEGV